MDVKPFIGVEVHPNSLKTRLVFVFKTIDLRNPRDCLNALGSNPFLQKLLLYPGQLIDSVAFNQSF